MLDVLSDLGTISAAPPCEWIGVYFVMIKPYPWVEPVPSMLAPSLERGFCSIRELDPSRVAVEFFLKHAVWLRTQ